MGIDVQVEGEEHERLVLCPHGVYMLSDRRLAPLDSSLVWCSACQAFTAGESIYSVEVVELELAKLQRGELDHKWFDFIHGVQCDRAAIVAKQIASLERKLHWRRRRGSPPKCLECGSTENRAIIESVLSSLFEPTLNRPIKVSYVLASTGIDFTLFAYSAEGDLLGEISRIAQDGHSFLDDTSPYEIIAERLRAKGVHLPS
ncbi:hypothetical protein NA78x_002102 [Anatilimnocola sp. NA78]|uniref:hypothetical protein n=1 Tax=Anatilimnocola sp. NA78 TaxID=3415683 RepID=UPI003CE4FFB6